MASIGVIIKRRRGTSPTVTRRQMAAYLTAKSITAGAKTLASLGPDDVAKTTTGPFCGAFSRPAS